MTKNDLKREINNYHEYVKLFGVKVAYNEFYLKSEYWNNLKETILKLHNNCCTCNKTTNLVIHHLSYKNLFGEEYGEDIVVICNECHSIIHNKKRKVKRKNKNIRTTDIEDKALAKWKKKSLKNRKFQEHYLDKEEIYRNKINELIWKRKNSVTDTNLPICSKCNNDISIIELSIVSYDKKEQHESLKAYFCNECFNKTLIEPLCNIYKIKEE